MTTSQVVRGLEKRDFVVRTAGLDDKRAQRVTLSANGRSTVRKAQPKVEKADAEFFAKAGKSASAIAGGVAVGFLAASPM